MAAVRRLPNLGMNGERLIERCEQALGEHASYVRQYGEDMPEIQEWSWPYKTAASGMNTATAAAC